MSPEWTSNYEPEPQTSNNEQEISFAETQYQSLNEKIVVLYNGGVVPVTEPVTRAEIVVHKDCSREENILWFASRYDEKLLGNLEKYSDATMSRVRKCMEAALERNKYIDFTDIDDFLLVQDLNPVLQEQSGKTIRYVEGGRAFYEGINKLIKAKGLDKKQTRDTFFVRKRKPLFSTLEEWLNFAEQKGYRGSKPSLISKTDEGDQFHQKFRKWVAKNYPDPQSRDEVSRLMWGDSYKTKGFHLLAISINNELVRFDSEAERLIGQLLDKYGLINKYIEGENLHHTFIRKQGWKMGSSVDFILYDAKTILEYHPLSIKDKQKGYLLDEAGEEKIRYLPLEYKDFWFYHIWDIDQLYDVLELIKDTLPDESISQVLKNLSTDQFKEIKKIAKNEAIEERISWLKKWKLLE